MGAERLRFGLVCCDTLELECRRCLERLGVTDDVEVVSYRSRCHLGCVGDDALYPAIEALLERVDGAVSLCQMCRHDAAVMDRFRRRLEVLPANTQAELFIGRNAADRALRERAFVVLPGWAKDWERVVFGDWKFDRDTARAFFRETSDRILYLDTGVGGDLDAQVRDLADVVGLPVERRFVGTSHLELALEHVFARARHDAERSRLLGEVSESRATAAYQATMADFLTGLGSLPDAGDVIARLRETAAVLFAPEETAFLPADAPVPDGDDGASFHIPVCHGRSRFGTLAVRRVALPAHRDRYRPMAQMVCDAAAVALQAAALFQREQALAAALQAKVDELDDFAYVVSHDLKAPVAAVRSYGQFLKEDFASDLPSEAARHVDAILAAADRMRRQIDDILTLSRIGRQGVAPSPVDLAEVVAEVVAEVQEGLAIPLRGRAVDVSIGSLPVVTGAARWIREALHNLVSNAIKYNDKARPILEVASRPSRETDPGGADPSRVVVTVRDNGVGIPPEHQERVFDLFCRLGDATGPEGSGAGLAIVRRIVQREGGRVWLESVPGEGTTFFLTLPRWTRA